MNAVRRFLKFRANLIGLILVVAILGFTLVVPWLSPFGPSAIDPRNRLKPPGFTHLFGTDHLGRDLLTRVAIGGKISIMVGFSSIFLALVIGSFLGLFAAFSSRVAEDLIMRAMDILMSFPYIILAVTLMAVLGRSELNIIMVIAITRIPQFARVSRAAALSLRSKEFVESAITIGQSKLYIVGRHILPNCLGSIVVLSTLSVATAIHTEAAISFLGLGITPPTPSWGLLMNESRPYLFNAPWVALWPGFMITIAVLGINFLGDGLRDTLDVTLIASEKK